MTSTLAGQVVIVTGAGRGIGRAIALAFGRAGAEVVAVSRTEKEINATIDLLRSEGHNGEAISCDITSFADVDRMVERAVAMFGHVDVLVNNAGIMLAGPILEMAEEDWDTVLDTNLKGTFLCTQRVGKVLAAQGHGKILNIGSTFGKVPVRGHAAYCTSKAALVQFTQVVALELAPHNVQVNALAPGYVDTELNAEILADEENMARVLRRIPLKRVLGVDELAPVALFLASSAADYMTGEVVYLDGGYKLT